MLLFFLVLAIACSATDVKSVERSIHLKYSSVSAAAPSLLSIIDNNHQQMKDTCPVAYTESSVAAFDADSDARMLNYWGLTVPVVCTPNPYIPVPGACLVYLGSTPVGTIVPYKSTNFTSIYDSDHEVRDDNGKYVGAFFGNVIVFGAGVSLTTPAGVQTTNANDAIFQLQVNLLKVGKYPYDQPNTREVFNVTSRFYANLPVNSQGKQNQRADFDVTDEDGNVGYGMILSSNNYVSGHSGDVRSEHDLIMRWPLRN